MSARIIPFVARGLRPFAGLAATATMPISAQWNARHLPLIFAAVDLLAADDADFAGRCRAVIVAEGRGRLEQLAGQIEKLAAHLADLVRALGMTATRIRGTLAMEVGADV